MTSTDIPQRAEKRVSHLLSETAVFAWKKSKCCGARHVNSNLVQYSELIFTPINVINIVMFLYPDVIFLALSDSTSARRPELWGRYPCDTKEQAMINYLYMHDRTFFMFIPTHQ